MGTVGIHTQERIELLQWGGKTSYCVGEILDGYNLSPEKMDGLLNYTDNRVCPPIHKVLEEICTKLEGIERLEKKMTEVTDNFTEELGLIKGKLANLTVESKKDSGEIKDLQGSIKYFSYGLQSTNERQEDLRMKLVKLENTNNMMSERIEKLERCNAKLSEDMKLFEEREKRKIHRSETESFGKIGQ